MQSEARYIGLDVHKHSVMVAGVDKQQRIILKPLQVSLDKFPEWARRHLTSSDQVALEATSNAWLIHDELCGLFIGFLPIVLNICATSGPHWRVVTVLLLPRTLASAHHRQGQLPSTDWESSTRIPIILRNRQRS
jgi:hypothetical protein